MLTALLYKKIIAQGFLLERLLFIRVLRCNVAISTLHYIITT